MFEPLYLHFLDRELREAVDFRPSSGDFEAWIGYLLLCSPAYLYCGVSPLWETSKIGGIVVPLVRDGHLHLLSAHISLDEFIVSRRSAYAHDRGRYPRYFSDRFGIYEGLAPTHTKSQSATELLRKNLILWSMEDVSFDTSSRRSRRAEVGVKALIHTALNRLTDEAITFAFFESQLQSSDEPAFAAALLRRRISVLYTQHYLDVEGGDIATGIRGLETFDVCARSFPYYDLPILNEILSSLGIARLVMDRRICDKFLPIRGKSAHRTFCDKLRLCLAGLTEYSRNAGAESGDAHPLTSGMSAASIAHENRRVSIVASAAMRLRLHESTERLFRNVAVVRGRVPSDVLLEASFAIDRLTKEGRLGGAFVRGVEQAEQRFRLSTGRVVIVVATPVERDAVLQSARGANSSPFPKRFIGDHTYFDLGHQGGCELFLVQSEAGSGGAAGSLMTVHDSILALQPSAIVMTGIAFGTRRDKHQIGDILVARQLWSYEPQRIGPDGTLSRGDKVTAPGRLLDRFTSGEAEWRKAPVRFGLVGSGEKLVDSKAFVEELLEREPEAIGGEMEGAGLLAGATKGHVEAILVKAICDWGMDKNNPNKERDQLIAATNAADFVLYVVRTGGLATAVG